MRTTRSGLRLNDAVVLVTGASGGIGAAVARACAARGAELVVTGRDAAAVGAVASVCGGYPVAGDVRAGTDEDPGAVATRAVAVRGRVDVLVCAAGVGWAGGFGGCPPETIRALVEVNLLAPMLLARALLPPMVDRGRGHVVLVSSIAGLTGVAGEVVYSATKAGLTLFAQSLRAECAGTGVGVSAVAPGAVDTGFFERRGAPYGRGIPRLVPPERIADAVVRCIERDIPDVVVPRWLGLAPRVRGAAPGLYRVLSARFGGTEFGGTEFGGREFGGREFGGSAPGGGAQ